MSHIAVVYWSGTGHTKAMAEKVAEGVTSAGGTVTVLAASEFHASMMDDYDAIAFGCPSMGAEQLEESEFEPMFQECTSKLNGKKIALFGSYGWGDGEWMRTWEEDCKGYGAILAKEPVICNEEPTQTPKAPAWNLEKLLYKILYKSFLIMCISQNVS